jgi:hypothetical protein
MKTAIVVAFFFLFIGCAPKMYYYGNYSSTLYQYKKSPNDKTLEKHMKELNEIIVKSKEDALRVPPGICCEYAYFLLQKGNKDEALRYIQMEENTYPESIVFTKRLKRFVSGEKPDTVSSQPAKNLNNQ